MANTVGSVAIDLEARIAKFESDLGRAARIAEQRSSEMRASLGKVVAALGVGVSINGFKEWIQHALDAQDELSKLSQKVAVSTETLSGWELAAKQAGVATEAMQKGLIKLGQSAALATEGSKLQADAFKSIGVSATDASGHLKSTQVLFEQVAEKISKYKDSTEKTVIATRLFGKAGADLIPLLNAGKEGLADYVKMADDFGIAVGSKTAKAAERFNDSVAQLGLVSKGLANQIAGALAPALADLSDKAVAFFRSQDWKRVLNDISTGAKYVADHVGDIINAVKLLGEILVTVYALKALKYGADWITSLSLQTTATQGLIVAQAEWGATTASSFALAKKNIGIVGIAFNLLGSAIAGWQIGSYLRDEFLQVRLAGIALVDGLLTSWERIKQGGEIAWAAIKASAYGTINSIRQGLADLATAEAGIVQHIPITGATQAAKLTELAAKLRPATSATDDLKASITSINAATEKNITAIHENTGELADYEIAQDAAKNAAAKHIPIIDAQGKALGIVNDNAKDAAKALLAFQAAQDALNAKAADAVSGYLGKNLAPDAQAWADYADAIRKVAEAEGERITKAKEAIAAGTKGIDLAGIEADAQKRIASAIEQTNGKLQENLELARQKINFGQKMADDAIRDANIAAMSARDQAIARAGIAATNEALAQHRKLTDESVQAQVRLAQQGAATAYDLAQYAQRQQQIAQEYAGFWENAAGSISKSFGDLISGQTRNWKDFGASLKSIAQQFVSDIISTFLRLNVLGPLMSGALSALGGLFGASGGSGGASIIKIVSDYYGGGSSVGSAPGAVGGSGSAGYAGMLQNLSQAKSLYSYVMGGGVNMGGAGNIASVGVDSSGHAVAFNPWANPSSGSYYGGMSPSIGGYAAPYASVAGGLVGAYYGAHQGDGGLGTVGSTVAYGALGAGISGTAAGVAGGMSTGAAAGSAFGTAAASSSWIPIVGWVAALAALADHFSGGKVFGTKYRTDASNVDLNIGPDGSSADAQVHQWKYVSGLSAALGHFGVNIPSDWGKKDFKMQDVGVTPEMTAAAKSLYDNIEKTLVQGAQKLGVTAPDMIEASLKAQSTYDKKGKLTATNYVVDYLGRTWKEATADAAAQRLGAEALVRVVEASAGAVAQSIAEQFRGAADTLMDGAQTMLAAQSDIKRGNSLVATGASATLAQVIAFTETMQADGEKLADTYSRLVQASAAYLQFVGQFAPVSTSFGASLEAIAKQMQSNIDQANALAQAAGLAGAKESDLANIHQFAAQQAADAIAQLNSAAQDLAAKLYTVTGGTLAQVSAQLSAMQSKVQAAAQLAIGDNSPLSTKEKLDVALQGLRSGATSADDVLALGRKLYSSSADYTGLYNKVQDILQLPGATGQQGFADALSQYNQLSAQRDQLQSQADATARFADAKTLAQYIADISTTHGIDYGEAASGLGFNLSDLAKDLGVTNLTGYLDNLKLADIPGTTLDASASIVDAIQQLGRDLIATITKGPITAAGMGNVTAAPVESDPAVLALLASLDARLAGIEANTSDTAKTNGAMAKQGSSNSLAAIAGSSRSGA